MSEIFVGVAWPYANGPLHLGHIAGAYLPADIFARYHRLKGNEVLMVSGSDQHGTPITIRAEQEGLPPAEIAGRYHEQFLESWRQLGITFDLFTSTGTDNHARVSQDIFLRLLGKGFIYKDSVSQAFCPQCQRYLPDRYVEGTCPFCKSPGARGDQCDQCGKPMNTAELVAPRCRVCGEAPVFRDSEHFFLRLSAFGDRLQEWVQKQGTAAGWRPNVTNLTMRYLKEGLRDRAITRDISWGVPVPVPGYEDKRLYVWFEAVIGYLSASREWASARGEPDAWQPFWQEGIRSYYFIGKDNIPFHTLIWPAMLMGYGGLALPYDIPSNEFLTIEGRKLSTSQNWAVWLPDYLSRYDPDPLRYFLSINMPETGDTDFSWREFVRRNNNELVATYGNLVNRVLTFVYKHFNGGVPTDEDMGGIQPDDAGMALDTNAREVYDRIYEDGGLLSRCKFKSALAMAMGLAGDVNRYLEEKSPWKLIKENRPAAAVALYNAMRQINRLKTMLYPYLPFSSQCLHEFLGFEGRVEEHGWQPPGLPPGQKMTKPQPLFTKLDEAMVEAEAARLGNG